MLMVRCVFCFVSPVWHRLFTVFGHSGHRCRCTWTVFPILYSSPPLSLSELHLSITWIWTQSYWVSQSTQLEARLAIFEGWGFLFGKLQSRWHKESRDFAAGRQHGKDSGGCRLPGQTFWLFPFWHVGWRSSSVAWNKSHIQFSTTEKRRFWICNISVIKCLQCFDTVDWVSGSASGL